QDVGGRKTGVIQKVRDIVVGNVEIAEAVKQIHSATWPGAACDVVLYLSWRWSGRKVDLRVESGWCNWWLGQGHRAREGQEEREDENETWNNPRVFPMWLLHTAPPVGMVKLCGSLQRAIQFNSRIISQLKAPEFLPTYYTAHEYIFAHETER